MSTKKFLAAVFFSVFAFFAVGATQAHAATYALSGHAWSDDIGWISFDGCTPDSSGTVPACAVSVDSATGNLSGYAWSDNVGLIGFNQTTGCPVAGCTTQPKVNLATGTFSGFAYAVSASAGGNTSVNTYDGWIALSSSEIGQMANGGPGGNPTGPGWMMDPATGIITGAAWGGINFGWIVPSSDMKILLPSGGPYTITASSGPNGTVTPTGVTTVSSGGSQTYTITPSAGYKTATLTVDGTSKTVAATYSFTNVTANHTISATFTLAGPYTITACSPSNGSLTPTGVSSVPSTTSKTYTITPNSGYAVSNLTIDGTAAPAVNSYTFSNVVANHTICAAFSTSGSSGPYTITASSGPNGSVTPDGDTTVAAGGSQAYIIKPDSGFTTESVTIDGASHAVVPQYTFANVTANHTISATFIASGGPTGPYTITASSGPNGSVTPDGDTTVASGGSQSYSITPAPGYFIQTITIGSLAGTSALAAPLPSSYTFTNVKANYTIHATFSTSAPPTGVAQCSDGIDNDGDGFIDYTGGTLNGQPVPKDPQCSSPTDNSEGKPSIIYIES